MTKRFTPSGDGVEWGENHNAVAKCPNGRFITVSRNKHNRAWIRENKDDGACSHRRLDVITTDCCGGGPVYLTLAEARRRSKDCC